MVDYIFKKNEILKFSCRINKDAEYKYYITGFIRCLFIYQKKFIHRNNTLNSIFATENFHSQPYLYRFNALSIKICFIHVYTSSSWEVFKSLIIIYKRYADYTYIQYKYHVRPGTFLGILASLPDSFQRRSWTDRSGSRTRTDPWGSWTARSSVGVINQKLIFFFQLQILGINYSCNEFRNSFFTI